MADDDTTKQKQKQKLRKINQLLQQSQNLQKRFQALLESEVEEQQTAHQPRELNYSDCPEWTHETYASYINQAMTVLGESKEGKLASYETLHARKQHIRAVLESRKCKLFDKAGATTGKATFGQYKMLLDRPHKKFHQLARFAPRGMLHQLALKYEAKYAGKARPLLQRESQRPQQTSWLQKMSARFRGKRTAPSKMDVDGVLGRPSRRLSTQEILRRRGKRMEEGVLEEIMALLDTYATPQQLEGRGADVDDEKQAQPVNDKSDPPSRQLKVESESGLAVMKVEFS
ncbi:hypothetical protein Q7P37_003916 [Cladosporium fusiforme]